MEEEKSNEASLLDIWRFSRPQKYVILSGLTCAFLRGFATPIFAILYGRLFKALTAYFSSQHTDIRMENLINTLLFALLGIFAGLTNFASGSLFGYVGEKLSMRLRLSVYENLLRQDGRYYDDMKHSTGKLTARLSSDAPNVQAAIDQRLGKGLTSKTMTKSLFLGEVLQGLVALVCGISIAFWVCF